MDMPVTNKLLEVSSRILIVFSFIVDKFKITPMIQNKFPVVNSWLSGDALNLVVTVIVGILIILSIYGILINLCKVTLNFLIFTQWAVIGVVLFGVMYSILGA